MDRNVEGIQPLSPLQEGMLFHSLAAEEPGVYVGQLSCELAGALDVDAFRRAWQALVERHAVLRTAILWEDVERPIQVVLRHVQVPLTVEDWRSSSPEAQAERLQEAARAALESPFDLGRPPLLRLLLARLDASRYRFIWTQHHAVLDGWSLALLLRELLGLYDAFSADRAADLADLAEPRPYRDYLRWIEQHAGRGEAVARFWRHQLDGFEEPTALPIGRSSGSLKKPHGAEAAHHLVERRMPDSLLGRLEHQARRHRLTLGSVVHAAWALILARGMAPSGLDGRRTVVFGSVVSGRPPRLEGVEEMVGLFINTLPLRVDVAPQTSLAPWLGKIRARQVEIQSFEHSSLVEVQRLVDLPPGRSLFETLVVFENYPVEQAVQESRHAAGTAPAEAIMVREVESRASAHYPLVVMAMPGPPLVLRLTAEARRADATSVSRLLHHLEHLLEDITAALEHGPGQQLQSLWTLPRAERHQLLVELEGQDAEDGAVDVVTAFLRQAATAPDRIAVEADGEALSYAELAERVARSAARLSALGGAPESAVAVALDRSPELPVAVLATLAAGAAYLPVAADLPQARREILLAEARPRLIWDASGVRGASETDKTSNPRQRLEAWPDAGPPSPAPLHAPDPLHAAYLLYTSGSTGAPKGITISRHALALQTRWLGQRFRLGSHDRLLHKTSIAFDASVWELVAPFAHGATLTLAAPGTERDPAALAAAIESLRPTLVQLVPSQLAVLLEEPAFSRPNALRAVFCGGEALPAALCQRLDAKVASATHLFTHSFSIHNLYGPAETTINASVHTWRGMRSGDPVVLGRPSDGTRMRVVGHDLRPLPLGTAGELAISGSMLARGYLRRPAWTAERFVPDPEIRQSEASPRHGARLYRTGDLARRRSDGEIDYLGRADFQVKIRGVRIELGEIEAALESVAGVRRAAVVPVSPLAPRDPGTTPDPASGTRLVAYAEGKALEPDTLRAALHERLAAAVVPSACVVLETLPRNPSGKIDRAALSRLAAEGPRADPQAAEALPSAQVEALAATVAASMARVLGRDDVGRSDDFFALGGHSLLATRLLARLREGLEVGLGLRDLFAHPRPVDLARRAIELRGFVDPTLHLPPVRPAEISDADTAPASYAQERLWFLERLEERSAYHLATPVRLRGPLVPDIFDRAFAALTRRHAALRTRFGEHEGHPVQVVDPPVDSLRLPRVDLERLAQVDRGFELARLIRADLGRSFNLARGPLVRLVLARLNVTEHAALLNLHHSISDGWSTAILVRDLGELYAAARDGRAARLPELTVSYADYAAWQRRHLAGDRLERQLAWWRERLDDAPALLELPLDRPRTSSLGNLAGVRRFRLPVAWSQAVQDLARRQGATLFMVLLGAFQALLGRLSGQRDLIVGTAVAGRERPELEELVGFFVNTLPLRLQISPQLDFASTLARVREGALDAYAHQAIPFERLVEEIVEERDARHAPLVQALCVLQNAPLAARELGGLTLEPLTVFETQRFGPQTFETPTFETLRSDSLGSRRHGPRSARRAKFDLTLTFEEPAAHAGRLTGELEYRAELFDPTTAERLSRGFARFLGAALADPRRLLRELELLAPSERHQLLVESLPSNARAPGGDLPDILTAVVQRGAEAPDRVAVEAEGVALTYATLVERIQSHAERLRQLGIGPEHLVGVQLERSPELLVAVFATLEAGAAYFPIADDLPEARRHALLTEARPEVIWSADGMARVKPRPFSATSERQASKTAGARWPQQLPAYVIFTSGSTGTPKGVVISRHSLAVQVSWIGSRFGLSGTDRLLHKTSIAFDASIWEIVAPLLYGATLALAPPGAERDPAALATAVETLRPTVLQLVPSQLAVLLDEPAFTRPRTLRALFCGGEALSAGSVRRLDARLEEAEIHNFYGPTEATINASAHTWRGPSSGDPVVLGQPAHETHLRVVSSELDLLPLGASGELVIGGALLARGYLNQPGQTAERFVPDPHAEIPGARLYRSGDRARRRGDGELDYRGRLDGQVKIRGVRIEPGEIEAALETLDGVRRAAVSMDGTSTPRLVAFVEPDATDQPTPGPTELVGKAEGMDLGSEALREALRAKLPAAMVPALFVVLESLPRTASGKLDHRALRRQAQAQAENAVASHRQPPQSPRQEVLVALVAGVLGLEASDFGLEADFFALGGHSLLATRLIAQIQRHLGVDIPLRTLFSNPVLGDLAREIEGRRLQAASHASRGRLDGETSEVARDVSIPPVPRSPAPPLSFGQERFWFLHELDPTSAAYATVAAVRLRGTLDPSLLARVLAEITRRHEVLRTRFPVGSEGRPVQEVLAPETASALPRIDVSALSANARDNVLRSVSRRLAALGFDFASAPPWRRVLLHSEGEGALVLAYHHILYDGWSMAVLMREVAALYGAFSAGRPSPLPALPIQYADFAVWQRRQLSAGHSMEVWRRRLTPTLTAPPLPTDSPRPVDGRRRAVTVPFTVPATTATALRQLARDAGATLFMALLAAWGTLLHRLSGAETLAVGTPVAGRARPETEDMIGFFINTLAVAIDLSPADGETAPPTFRRLLERVRDSTLDAFDHQEVPFEKVVEALRPTRRDGDQPLFQTFLAFQNMPTEALELPGLQLEPLRADTGLEHTALFDLLLTVAEGAAENPGGEPASNLASRSLRCSLQHDAELFHAETADALRRAYLRLLDAVAANPGQRLDELPVLEDPAAEADWRRRAEAAQRAREKAHPPDGAKPSTPSQETALETGRVKEDEQARRSQLDARREKLSAAKKAILAKRLKGRKGRRPGATPATMPGGDSRAEAVPRRRPLEIPRRASGADLPLSHAQERLWFLDQLDPGSAAFSMPLPLRVRGPLKTAALTAAVDALEKRHEILRTRYLARDGQPFQVVDPPRRRTLPRVDLGRLGKGAEATAWALLASEAARGFDLEKGEVARSILVRLTAEDHVLAFNVHHIAIDGWSVGLLVHELGALYGAASHPDAGQVVASPLPALEIQYGDYAQWQRRRLRSVAFERQVRYWAEHLADPPPPLDLPTDRPRPPIQTFRGASLEHTLSPAMAVQLRGLAQSAETTLFVTLLAAFQVLMARLSGHRDIAVGAPIAGREARQLEQVIGLFLNTLVLRGDLRGRPTFRQLLRTLHHTALEAYSHQDVPFEKILEVLQPERDLSRTPLFQVFFNMLNLPPTEVRSGELSVGAVGGEDHVHSKFDLTVYLRERPSGLSIHWIYNADLFEVVRAQAMLDQFVALLEQVAAAPDTSIEALRLRTAASGALPAPSQALDATWHGGVHEIFAGLAAQQPERPAILEGRHVTSYGALERAANRLAWELRDGGVRTGDLVAIWAERRTELVLALLGTFKAGAAFLIFDPEQPLARHHAYLEQIEPRALLQLNEPPSELAERLAQIPCQIPLPPGSLESHPRLWMRPSQAPPVHTCADDLAYLAFTSGSTGKPKGILGRHGSLSHFIPWQCRAFDLRADDRYSLLGGLGHDPLHRDVFTPLQTGAAIAIPPIDSIEDPARLATWLRDASVTIAHLTPAMAQLLAEGTSRAPALRWAFLTGDVLTHLDVDRLRNLAPSVRAVNLYGSTETQRAVAYEEAARGVIRETLALGQGMEDVQLLILDRRGHPTALGELGEITLRSPHLSIGYLHEPARTAEQFTPAPNAPTPGERLYRTGDLGRYLPDGRAVFAGRADRQVQVRGFRVELGEIEAALGRHPAVREAAVVQASSPEPVLVGYLTPATSDNPPDPHSLRTHLAVRLPGYMVPAVVVVLDTLPVTPNRKIDRAALARRQLPTSVTSGHREPRTRLEAHMLELWRDVLGQDDLSLDDSFFELGGHSLLAARLVARVRAELGVDLPMRHLFQAPTVAGLAAAAAETFGEPSAAPGVDPLAELPRATTDPANQHQPFPLTEVQQAYWIGRSGSLELGGVATHSYQEIDATGVDLDRLERAWQRLIARHAMLRAVVLPDGQQRILPNVPTFRITRHDLRGLPVAEAETRLLALRQELSHQVLDPAIWPLFEVRASLLDPPEMAEETEQVEESAPRIRLHMSRDLLIYDAFSNTILGRDLARFYLEPDAALPPLDFTFRDYVMAEQALRETTLYRRAEAYWLRRADTLPPAPELPLATDPTRLRQPRFERRHGRLDAATWSAVQAHGRRRGLTSSAILLAAYGQALASYAKSPRFTLNLTLFNRLPLHPQVGGVVGDFTSLILCEIDTRPGEPFETQARRVQSQLWDDLDHRWVGGIWVLRELQRRRRGAGARMPVVFTSTLANRPATATAASTDASADPIGAAPGGAIAGQSVFGITQTSQVWLDHQVGENAGNLGFNWDSVAGLFPDGMVDELFTLYQELLESLAEEDGWTQPAPPLVPATHLELYAEANATIQKKTLTPNPSPRGRGEPESEPSDSPSGRGGWGARVSARLHDSFAARAAEQPDAPAVLSPSQHLTYGELDALANRLAHRLHAAGAHRGDLVAVVMDKSWRQVLAVLGILRAGGVYVPIDPELPRQRVAGLLERCGCKVALCQPRRTFELAEVEGPEWIPVDAAELGAFPTTPPPCSTTLDDLAYVIFTSGSTGQPKGVVIDHRGAANTCADVNRRFATGPGDRVLALSSLSFDLSVWDVFGVLGAGGAVIVPRAAERRDPAHWDTLVREHGVNIWNTVPALLQIYVEHLESVGRAAAPAKPDLERSGLRLAMMSGDWIPLNLPDRARALFPDVEVISLGGATEASIWSILHPVGAIDPAWTSIPYGRAMDAQSFHVLDTALRPRPLWVQGELFIGGIGLAKGYWRSPAQTASRFVPDPEGDGERLYRTGDLGRWHPEGHIEFLGREDFQVKIQGHRIELGEIEASLAGHPRVRDGVVLAAGPPQGNRRLVAWVTLADELDTETLRRDLRDALPAYMVPSVIHVLDALPLTANGKVDRGALSRQLDGDERREAGRQEQIAPRNAREATLAEVWSEVLGVEEVGVLDNFFELGGDSILGMRIVTRARAAGLELGATVFFEHQTVAEMAASLTHEEASTARVVLHQGPPGVRPLWCVHAAGGNVFNYAPLAAALGPSHTVYGLKASGFAAHEIPRVDVGEMAAAYLEEIRAAQPEGPYALLGWSFGGTVAWEIARRLAADGQEIALLGLLDTAATAPPAEDAPSERDVLQMALAGRVGRPAEELGALPTETLLELAAGLLRAAWQLPPDFGADGVRRFIAVYQACGHAWRTYAPPAWAAHAVLFRARGGHPRADGESDQAAASDLVLEMPPVDDSPALGWDRFAAELEIHELPGDHGSVLRPPHVEELARRLRGLLRTG